MESTSCGERLCFRLRNFEWISNQKGVKMLKEFLDRIALPCRYDGRVFTGTWRNKIVKARPIAAMFIMLPSCAMAAETVGGVFAVGLVGGFIGIAVATLILKIREKMYRDNGDSEDTNPEKDLQAVHSGGADVCFFCGTKVTPSDIWEQKLRGNYKFNPFATNESNQIVARHTWTVATIPIPCCNECKERNYSKDESCNVGRLVLATGCGLLVAVLSFSNMRGDQSAVGVAALFFGVISTILAYKILKKLVRPGYEKKLKNHKEVARYLKRRYEFWEAQS